ncbi:MAG: helix-turn-helix domain-containing protein [Candidatus Methanomethylicia archaeon]
MSEEEISNIYQVLSNPIRRKIIEILGARGSAGLRELMDNLGVSAGSVYYNIELLGDLVRREGDKRFILTEKGWMAYRLLMDGKEKFSEMKYYSRRFISLKTRSRISTILFPKWFFLALFEDKILRVVIPVITLVFGFITCYKTNVELILFSTSYKPLQEQWITAIKFLASWVIIYFSLEVLSLIIHGRSGGRGLLLLGLSISTLPLLAIPYIMIANISNIIQGIIILILQFASCILLSTAISASKNINLERAFLMAVLIVYLNITLNVIFRF